MTVVDAQGLNTDREKVDGETKVTEADDPSKVTPFTITLVIVIV